MPFVPDTSTPASMWSERIVTDLVIVRAPKPPGSSALISPAGAVFEIAPAKVLQGAVREHGLASSPTPDTHVRVACACAIPGIAISGTVKNKKYQKPRPIMSHPLPKVRKIIPASKGDFAAIGRKQLIDIGTGTDAAQGSGKREQSRAKNTSSE